MMASNKTHSRQTQSKCRSNDDDHAAVGEETKTSCSSPTTACNASASSKPKPCAGALRPACGECKLYSMVSVGNLLLHCTTKRAMASKRSQRKQESRSTSTAQSVVLVNVYLPSMLPAPPQTCSHVRTFVDLGSLRTRLPQHSCSQPHPQTTCQGADWRTCERLSESTLGGPQGLGAQESSATSPPLGVELERG